MTLTPCVIDIIRLLGQVIVSVYLRLCLNQSPFSLVPFCSKAKNTMSKKMIASMIQK